LLTAALYPCVQASLAGARVQYKQFVIDAFQQAPGKWRARIRRANGKPLRATGRAKLEQFITDLDATSAIAAMVAAMEVIDAGCFSRRTVRSTEKFWRRGAVAATSWPVNNRADAAGRSASPGRPRQRIARSSLRPAS
jgi:hypothetical protein